MSKYYGAASLPQKSFIDLIVRDGVIYTTDENGNEVKLSEYTGDMPESRFTKVLEKHRASNSLLESSMSQAVDETESVVNKRGLVVIINGCGGCGKDTFETMVQDELYHLENFIDQYHVSTIDPIREIDKELATINGEPYSKDKNAHRKAMAQLKRVWDENYDGSFKYLQRILNVYDAMHSSEGKRAVVFVHVREPENIQNIYFRHRLGLLTDTNDDWDVTSVLIYGRTSPDDFDNSADRCVENFMYETYINNSGNLEELHKRAKAYAEVIAEWANIYR